MSLEKITKQLANLEENIPPVELWDPPYCGEMDLLIKSNGDWLFQGSKITRQRLVKLFASVLKKEQQEYFLVTPVEKVKISVQTQPFIITSWQWLNNVEPLTMQLTTNLGDNLLLDATHPLTLDENGDLQVIVRRNLTAGIHRNVFYQWVDIAEQINDKKNQHLQINSAGISFLLGSF